jgi:hypothetical protein
LQGVFCGDDLPATYFYVAHRSCGCGPGRRLSCFECRAIAYINPAVLCHLRDVYRLLCIYRMTSGAGSFEDGVQMSLFYREFLATYSHTPHCLCLHFHLTSTHSAGPTNHPHSRNYLYFLKKRKKERNMPLTYNMLPHLLWNQCNLRYTLNMNLEYNPLTKQTIFSARCWPN